MSGVLHPVGPEREQTYWVRRGIVLGTLAVLAALVVALVQLATATGSAVAANPSPAPAASRPAGPTTPLPWDTTSPTPATPTPASPSPSPGSSASATPSAKAPPKPKPVACTPDRLRTTLSGRQSLKAEQPATFRLSLVNETPKTCTVSVRPATFALRISSGTDPIWSTTDCPKTVRTLTRTLGTGKAVRWSVRWDGSRSGKGCTDQPEVPRPGTYLATAQLDGADPVRLRLVLHG